MSHHFDTATATEDPRINLSDAYLFEASPGRTVMIMTVNPDAGLSAPDTFRDEGLYEFKFDLDGDLQEDLSLRVTFSAPQHAEGNEHVHVQTFEVRRATGPQARQGAEGELLGHGRTGEVLTLSDGGSAWAGLAADAFAGDAGALGKMNAGVKQGSFDPAIFQSANNFFARRNVTAIVLEFPSGRIGTGTIGFWATVSLHGHAPQIQVSRWGTPLLTHIFLTDPDIKEAYNRAHPSQDRTEFLAPVAANIERIVTAAKSTPDPVAYARKLGHVLLPSIMRYEVGTPASHDFAGFNGRGLNDDVMDVMLTLTTNLPLGDGVPTAGRVQSAFPFVGLPTRPLSRLG